MRENIKIQGKAGISSVFFIIFIVTAVGSVFYLKNRTISTLPKTNVKVTNTDVKKYERDRDQVNRPPAIPSSEGEGSAEQEKMIGEKVDAGYRGMIIDFKEEGLFSESERQEIRRKVAEPFFDYNFDNKTEYTLMQIGKYSGENYKYNIYAYAGGGIQTSFLFGTSEPLEWWVPECMNECVFTPEFEKNHPEVVSAYKSGL